ncbi:MAG: hypothetical protein Q9184_007012 [Pyrenodesmia sp. 2 TL-2023]
MDTSTLLRNDMYMDNMAHWQAIVRCLQEWQASGTCFIAWPWERKMYPYARASIDQIFLGLSRTEEQLVHEATQFSNFAVGRLRELYAEMGKGEAFIRQGIPPVEENSTMGFWRWVWILAFIILIPAIGFGSSKFNESTTSSRSSSHQNTTAHVVILKDFQVATTVIPPLASIIASAANPSSGSKIDELSASIVSACSETIGVLPPFFAQLEDFTEGNQNLLLTATRNSLPVHPYSSSNNLLARIYRYFYPLPPATQHLLALQRTAKTLITAPTLGKLQLLVSKQVVELDTMERLLHNFIHMRHTSSHERRKRNRQSKSKDNTHAVDQKDKAIDNAAEQLLNTVRGSGVAVKRTIWFMDIVSERTETIIGISDAPNNNNNPDTSDPNTGTKTPSGATATRAVSTLRTAVNLYREVIETVDNWTGGAEAKDGFLFQGDWGQRIVNAGQGVSEGVVFVRR